MIRIGPVLVAFLAVVRAAGAAPMPEVRPATMTVEVVSLRNGGEGRKIVANTRPGESVLLRDENAVPYLRHPAPGRSETASVSTGLVTVVTPVIRDGNLVIGLATTVREVSGLEREPGTPEGAPPQVPSVRERTFETMVPATYAAGTFLGLQEMPGTGFGVRVKVRAIAR